MARRKTTIDYWVPDWAWCEMPNPDGKTKTGDRCRFCQEIKKRGDATRYRCLIHNQDLLVRGGSVEKASSCLLWKTNQVSQEPPALAKPKSTALSVGKCVIKSLKEFVKQYKSLRKEGYPEYLALDMALEVMTNQWK